MMKRDVRPERFKDQHLPLASALARQEKGQNCGRPSRAIRKRAARMQGRGSNFTDEEIEVAFYLMSETE
jgi:hypothetical protein